MTDPNEVMVPRDWLRKAADLVAQVERIYGGPLAICDSAIAVNVILAGRQDDEHSCSFYAMIPLPRGLARVTGTGHGNAGLFVEALEEAVRGKVALWEAK